MSIESSPFLATGEPSVAPASRARAQAPAASDGLLAPLDHLHDVLAGDLARLDRTVEAHTADVPLVGPFVQFAAGAGSAVAGMVDGTYQMVRHPLAALSGVWSMASHVPFTPMWLWRGARDGFGTALGEDRMFWVAAAKAMADPYRKDLAAHRYFAVAGRAAVDIGTLYIGARQAEQAIETWRAQRAERLAAASDEANLGLKAAVEGTDPAASGQVLGEGTLVHRPGMSPGQSMVERVSAHPGIKEPGLPATESTREQLEAAAERFAGDRRAVRSQAIAQLRRDQKNFLRINRVGPERLATDAAVQRRYRLLAGRVENRMNEELGQVLGVEPVGAPKDPLRAAAKLEGLQADGGSAMRLGNLDDLARGRINLDRFDTRQIRAMLETLKEHYGRDNLIIHDYMRGKPFYRGRLHVKIRDGSGLWYELQIGPKQLSTFYDTPFALGSKSVCIHDAVYKGLMRLDTPAIRALGKGDVVAGKMRLAHVLDDYVNGVDNVIALARQGRPFDFASTAKLRAAITQTVQDIPPALRPIGLQ